ncbi:MAG TPA: hypothetical protein VFS10_11755 [Pyrinomonadaceae bacterium]|nr:hypothetical protein [Pyrinomonadaceae bacterium]
MERSREGTHVSPSDETIPIEPERTVVAPRFDRKSIQSAQPAVPLDARKNERRRASPAAFVLLCVVAGIAGGLLGAYVLSRYQRDARPAANAQPQPAPNTAAASQAVDAQTAPATTTQAPPEANAPDAQIVEAEGLNETASGGEGVAPDADSQATLRGALGEWIAATNARDISKQMSFYGTRVNAFYLSRNASREAVRAEKARVLGRAETVDVSAGEPDIRLSRDGQTATMRFRKKYSISGGDVGERRGEVLQELRWQRTPDGWKIVSERDLRVLQ